MPLKPAFGLGPCRRQPGRAKAAFTLIEVLLAVAIAGGILGVLFYFYQQAASLRAQLIAESERIATIRLLMDRLTTELRGACARSSPRLAFSGTGTSLRFVTRVGPAPPGFARAGAGASIGPDTGFRLVSYSLARVPEGTNYLVSGLVRAEHGILEAPSESAITRTNEVAVESSANPAGEWTAAELLTEAIRYLRFRYWDGESWLEAWQESDLPKAVEVSLAPEPLPDDATEEDYPADMFRRVICLPAGEVGMDADLFSARLQKAAWAGEVSS